MDIIKLVWVGEKRAGVYCVIFTRGLWLCKTSDKCSRSAAAYMKQDAVLLSGRPPHAEQ